MFIFTAVFLLGDLGCRLLPRELSNHSQNELQLQISPLMDQKLHLKKPLPVLLMIQQGQKIQNVPRTKIVISTFIV